VSTGSIEIRKSKDKQQYFVVKAANGRILVQSETYKTEAALKKGVLSMRKVMQCGNLKYAKDHPKYKSRSQTVKV